MPVPDPPFPPPKLIRGAGRSLAGLRVAVFGTLLDACPDPPDPAARSRSTPRNCLDVADDVVAPPGALIAAVLLGLASTLLFADGLALNCFGFSCAAHTSVKPANTAAVNKNRIALLESERPVNPFEARPIPLLALPYVNPSAHEITRSNLWHGPHLIQPG